VGFHLLHLTYTLITAVRAVRFPFILHRANSTIPFLILGRLFFHLKTIKVKNASAAVAAQEITAVLANLTKRVVGLCRVVLFSIAGEI